MNRLAAISSAFALTLLLTSCLGAGVTEVVSTYQVLTAMGSVMGELTKAAKAEKYGHWECYDCWPVQIDGRAEYVCYEAGKGPLDGPPLFVTVDGVHGGYRYR